MLAFFVMLSKNHKKQQNETREGNQIFKTDKNIKIPFSSFRIENTQVEKSCDILGRIF